MKYAWVLDMDISKFFDTINHELLMKAVSKHVEDKWILLYIERWLKVPYQTKGGTMIERDMGVSQGGLCITVHNPPYRMKYKEIFNLSLIQKKF